jgi:AraC-like DNA-binding protein
VFVLTGMRGVDFRMAYQVRMADELLRYTDLTIAEVSRRAGFGSANNLYLTYKREFDIAPGYRRIALREDGDVGRFKL